AYEDAKALADSALSSAMSTARSISAAGSIDMYAGGDIGSAGSPLEISSAGPVGITSGGSVNIASNGDLSIGRSDAQGNAVIISTGSISSEEIITAPELEIAALGGDIGSRQKPLVTRSEKISGTAAGDIFITNRSGKDLALGPVGAGGDIVLTTGGNIVSPEGDGADLIASKVDIRAAGNVGSKDEPLKVSADEVSVSGKDISLRIAGDTAIVSITGNHVTIESDGRIDAGSNGGRPNVTASSLDVTALGDIGSAQKPLHVFVPGPVSAHSVYGTVHIVNSFRPESYDWEDDGDGAQKRPDIVRRPDGSSAPYEMIKIDEMVPSFFIARIETARYRAFIVSYRLCSVLRQLQADEAAKAEKSGAVYIRALSDDDPEKVTEESRVLVLDHEFIEKLRKDNVRFVFFRVGNRVLVIDLDRLEEGDWKFLVDLDGMIPKVTVTKDKTEVKDTKDICQLSVIFEQDKLKREGDQMPRQQ
ncbi:MAG: hypothetical protein J5822_05785, partial [Eubacteriaceae bacterium]|nr:hypothetical protein [Eubacteriaceae bacterium]